MAVLASSIRSAASFFISPDTVPPIFLQLPIAVGQKKFVCVFLMVVAMRHFSFYPKIFENNFLSPYDFTLFWGAATVPPISLHLPIVVGKKKFVCVLLMVVAMRHFGFTRKISRKKSFPPMTLPYDYSCACAAIWFLRENY